MRIQILFALGAIIASVDTRRPFPAFDTRGPAPMSAS
jgi:hypothetical protein